MEAGTLPWLYCSQVGGVEYRRRHFLEEAVQKVEQFLSRLPLLQIPSFVYVNPWHGMAIKRFKEYQKKKGIWSRRFKCRGPDVSSALKAGQVWPKTANKAWGCCAVARGNGFVRKLNGLIPKLKRAVRIYLETAIRSFGNYSGLTWKLRLADSETANV